MRDRGPFSRARNRRRQAGSHFFDFFGAAFWEAERTRLLFFFFVVSPRVAGTFCTAELKSESECKSASSTEGTAGEAGEQEAGKTEGCQSAESEGSNTDAWFTSFAPAQRPRIAVCVLLVKDGAGGDTAAPVAREVLEAGLRASH